MVGSGAQLAAAHPWIGAYSLGRDELARGRARRLTQQVGLRVRAHGWRASGAVGCAASNHGQVNVLVAEVVDRVAAAVGHDDVVPGT